MTWHWADERPGKMGLRLRPENGRSWHLPLEDKGTTLVSVCGIEMSRGAWWQSNDVHEAPLCAKCKKLRPDG